MSPTKCNTPAAEDCLEATYWRGINNDHAWTSVLLSQQPYSPLNPSPHLSYPQEPHLNHRLTLLIIVEDIYPLETLCWPASGRECDRGRTEENRLFSKGEEILESQSGGELVRWKHPTSAKVAPCQGARPRLSLQRVRRGGRERRPL